ncbi:MAG: carbohydrate ABC transporter permease [Clostridium sp.]
MSFTRKQKQKIGSGIWYVTVTAISIIMITPFLWALVSSFKPDSEILSNALDFTPNKPTLEHYKYVFSEVPVFRYAANSLFVAICLVGTNLFFGSLAGYSFAKLKFKGSRTAFLVLMSSMMIPGIVTMIPNFLIIKHFPLIGGNDILGQGGIGMLNNLMALIIPGAVGAYAVFMMKQFYEGLPASLGEAARIDGCSEFRVFYNIYLPQTKPALATLGFMTFISGWNVYMGSILYISNEKLYTLQQGLAVFKSASELQYGRILAGSMISLVPIIILFLFAQKYYVKGFVMSGSKG